jgi:hypothetical protein
MNKFLLLLLISSAQSQELEYFDSKIDYWNNSAKL